MNYKVIGLMSGTSLDGLDIAHCIFDLTAQGWTFAITEAETIPYPPEWKKRLAGLETAPAFEFVETDVEFGHLSGSLTRAFIDKHSLRPGLVASHGHTIFHQPRRRITCQIGRGSAIAAETGLPVICDFRSLDVALGGQGAPLVPIGDALLFGNFDFCLNIGGFANISHALDTRRIAYDVCAANIVLNRLAALSGLDYDPNGELAASGSIDLQLLGQLNKLPYFREPFPKSLGKEWVVSEVLPLLDREGLPVNTLLATFCEHIAIQIAAAVAAKPGSKVFVTGGGAFNGYLIDRIRALSTADLIIPDPLTVSFKEALIFAFLGVLRYRGEVNCLQSVTGACHDSSGGAMYGVPDPLPIVLP